MKKLLSVIIILFPWKLQRLLLVKIWKYEIHPTARIGLSYIYPKKLIMKKGSKIGHFNVAVHLDKIEMGENASIGRSNWITGFPTGSNSKHFAHQVDRKSVLMIGKESAITKHHHIDCTNQITIGDFVTVAGYYSQFLTHSIDIYENRQSSNPITIGDYCFVGTNSVILGGAALPAFSVLGANALLNKKYSEQYTLYGGVPAKPTKSISQDAKYFNRVNGFVY
jgi:acetyltransferase-like isoleucine patch superfamily enzyme